MNLIPVTLIFIILNTWGNRTVPSQDALEVIKLGTGTEFKFKGLTVDIDQSVAYLGSHDQGEIVSVSLTENRYEVLKTKYSGKLHAMGCYLKNDRLYVVMNEVGRKTSQIAVLLVVDVKSKQLVKSYESVGINGRNHFNHVVADNHGVVYISNTLKSAIHTVDTQNPQDSIRRLIEHPDLAWVHGIDLSPDGSKLFTTAYEGGIKFFDLRTGTFSDYRDLSLAGDDGLKYYDGFLYGVGQNMIRRYTLDSLQHRVTHVDTLLANHDYFNDPRCLYIEDGLLYCLANIEFEPVYFRKPDKTYRETALTDTYLLKFKLPR